MRIISGEYRGRVLKSPSGERTRPTSDRLRETLFNIIAPRLDSETRFLDLCAGTGAIGIEALSRGANFAAFVDKSRRACGLIEVNLDLLQIPEEQTEVICSGAESYLGRKPGPPWRMIYFDPPYSHDYAAVLHAVGHGADELLADDGILIVEHHVKNALPDISGDIRRWRIVKQGESCLSFYERD
ncbi:MAG: 16S rRNA (guanine(966)-N(2))-methyltransferase RsmD [Acidobacteria bacterium]|nr:16S rRNA (guanine(966)-N(2))-methyltransferase RsmD [Acidobacteriota bacterium]MBK8811408.1 16S rRNA (guanine(966)-N(2))-methyltransferase RsmD [Acidobacteriota bacterium]